MNKWRRSSRGSMLKKRRVKPRSEKSTRRTLEQSFQIKGKTLWQQRLHPLSTPYHLEGVILQVRCVPISNTPSRMSTSSPYSSCFTKASSSSYWRRGVLGRQMILTTAYIIGYWNILPRAPTSSKMYSKL